MNMEKRGRTAAESERIIFYTELKRGGGGILTVSTVFWYFISCKKGELKFTKLKSLKIRELFSIKE